MKITHVDALQIFDSRGNPTLEVWITLENGIQGRGLVPSGASTGRYEALELRDHDPARFRGKSVLRAAANVTGEIAGHIHGHDVFDQRQLDQTLMALDGTDNKSRLGANAILGVSLAAVDAAAKCKNMCLFEYLSIDNTFTLPLPEIQIIGGGAHANRAIDIQDIMIVAVGARCYEETLEITHNIYHAVGDLLARQNLRCGLADEGGYWPTMKTNREALDLCIAGIEHAGYTPGVQAALSLDIAASDFYNADSRCYEFKLEGRKFDSSEFCGLMADWCRRYPVVALEDPAADIDHETWRLMHGELGDKITLIGDDLFVTNLQRIAQGIKENLANAVLIKLNQIGTVSQTLDAIALTRRAGWLPVVSARSGETEDAFISHLAVATHAPILKVGSFARSERMAKWNEVLRIQHRLGKRAEFLGGSIFRPSRRLSQHAVDSC